MAAQLDLVINTVSSAFGTSTTIPLGAAASVNGVTFLSFLTAGAVSTIYDYSILDTANTEIGTITYSSAANTLTGRTPTKSTNGNAAIAGTSAALVTCTLRAETAQTFFNTIVKQLFLSSATSSGIYTPSAGMVGAIIEGIGGGGAGGAAIGSSTLNFNGGGGGSGGYSRVYITSSYGSQTYVLGAGGVGGSSNGANGSDTVVGGVLLSAKGGAGGTFASGSFSGGGGAGGGTGVGDVVAAGMAGGWGLYSPTTTFGGSGQGGASVFGGSGAPVRALGGAAAAGSSGANYGGGGSGAQSNAITGTVNGGSGAYGALIVTEFCRQ